MNKEQHSAIRNQIIEYIKMYHSGGEGIGVNKIMNLFDGLSGNCPVCNGTGNIALPVLKKENLSNKQLIKSAHSLRKSKYTIREIAAVLGFKNPGSITHLLNKKP